jgi:dephospho-CoA kinase
MATQHPRTAPRLLGLTGPIGCGKTTVGNILLGLGARERIDADDTVHELQRAGTEVTRAIAGTFGPDVLSRDGSVDRQALGAIVFTDRERLAQLEDIVHPAVRQAIRERIEQHSDGGVVIIDAVKLLQSDLLPLVEEVWVVRCSSQVQRSRLVETRSMTPEAVEARLRAQPSFEHPRVTRIIENSGTFADLQSHVATAWNEFILHRS